MCRQLRSGILAEVVSSPVRTTIIAALILLPGAGMSAFAQAAWTPAAGTSRIAIVLPDKVPSESVWIRYLLTGKGGNSYIVTPQPHLRQYLIYRNPAQEAKLAVYAPGCEFKAYTFPAGNYDVSVPFSCQPLPTITLHGFVPPAEIPASMFKGTNLLIAGELEADWVCDYFLFERRPGTSGIMGGGSCLGAPTPLGVVGELDPAKQGKFAITMPDFTRDPLFKGSPEVVRMGRFGVIEFALRDKTTGRALGVLKPEHASTPSGLAVRGAYLEPVKFTTRQ